MPPINTAPTFSSGDRAVTTAIGSGLDFAYGVALQSDGRIVVAGHSDLGANDSFSLVRYNADGSLDTSFGGDGTVTTTIGTGFQQGRSVAIQSDGRIVAAGYSEVGANSGFTLVRYNADGSLDTSFDGDGIVGTAVGPASSIAQSVTLQPDGRILAAGHASDGSGSDFALVRYNPDGSLDTSFDGDGVVLTPIGSLGDIGNSVALQSDGRIVVAGYLAVGPDQDFALARYNPDGSLDTSFGGDGTVTTAVGPGSDVAYSVAVQPDGRILVSGYSSNGANDDFALVRYNADGSLDTSFGGDGTVTTAVGPGFEFGHSVVVQPDGQIVVAGNSSNGTNDDLTVLRYNADGSLDPSFSGDGIATVAVGSFDYGRSVAIQPDGRIVVAGGSLIGTTYDFAAVRFNADGTLDPSFGGTNTLDGAPAYTENGAPVSGFSVAEGDRVDLQGQSFTLGTAADGSVVLTLSGGGTITLAGVTSFEAGFVL